MSIAAADAIKAYAGQVKTEIGSSAGPSQSAPTQGSSFADMLANQVKDAVETGQASEQMAAKAVAGQAELVDVVTAISAAEVTLESVVAVRDRVIGAYQEIMRMPI